MQNKIKSKTTRDFRGKCRNGESHDYEIVEGPMVDDIIYNYINNYIEGIINKSAFWELVKFKHHTQKYIYIIKADRLIDFIEYLKMREESNDILVDLKNIL